MVEFNQEKWNEMREEILKRIKPSPESDRAARKVADEFADALNRMSPSDIEVMLTGSFAKDTYIRADVDFDMFVLFPDKYTIDELQSMAFEWGKKLLDNWEIAYAQHPYIRGTYKGYHIDLVPSYKIKDGMPAIIRSAVDRTQLHTKYVLEHITESQKDDVRILKRFLKRLGIYGAEIKTGGFSGYLCELLILKYGSFYNLIMNARNWKFPVVVDMHGGRSERLLRTLFKGDTFVVTDPVDKKRNVASPVSVDSLSTFVAAAHVFFIAPHADMFFHELELLTQDEIRRKMDERGTSVVLFAFAHPLRAEDILWGEIRKTLKAMENAFDKEGFDCTHQTAEVHDGKCYMLFELVHDHLPTAVMQEGPYVRMGQHVERFIKEEMDNLDIFVKDERVCAVRKRKLCTAHELADAIQKDPLKYGVSKGLREEVSTAKVFFGSDALFEDSRAVFTKHFNRKFYLGL